MCSIKFIRVVLVTIQVAGCTVMAELIKTNIIELEETLNTYLNYTKLANEICSDIQNDDFDEPSLECSQNFLEPHTFVKEIPPTVKIRCTTSSSIKYNIGPMEDGGLAVVVLIPENETVTEIPYGITDDYSEEVSAIFIQDPGRYQTWSALLNVDGTHSRWRRGPDITTRNSTGEIYPRNYTIRVKMDHERVDGINKVRASFSWNTFDENDTCFTLGNNCGKGIHQVDILSGMARSVVMSQLPLDTACDVYLSGGYGSTRLFYRTPHCSQLTQCVDSEKVNNLTLEAEPSEEGWTIAVSWSRPQFDPIQYNVSLFAEDFFSSVIVSGNETQATFDGVEASGMYSVAVGAKRGSWTAYTSARAIFPERREPDALAPAGAWWALAALVATAAAALLWRRRRSSHAPIYFQDPEDKAPQEVGDPLDSEPAEDKWELRPERLLLHEVVGEGAFGVVRRGTLAPGGREVAVKMLKDFPTLEEVRSFRSEMELMKSVGAHPHVVSLVGVCSRRRPLIVAEYCSRGDLLTYLRCSWDVMVSKRNAKYYNNNTESSDYRNDLFKCKPPAEHSKLVVNKLYDLQGVCDTDLTTRDLLSFCRQIAMGMEFLASNRLVHRDLAARNVLVASDRTLKIADFGLSRDVYEENQYKQKGCGKMPMKWMALESLTHRIYTTQSDVWSFGVVMWEVGSVGCSPYAGVAGARLPRLLRAGYRMPRPAHCPRPLYDLMTSCWRAHPRERPTFSELHARLDELLNRACADDYLRLDMDLDLDLDLDLDGRQPVPVPAHKYVRMIIRSKLGWSRGESYERPLRAAPAQSNHYSSPPAALARTPIS